MENWEAAVIGMKERITKLDRRFGEEVFPEVLEACWRLADKYDWDAPWIPGLVMTIASRRIKSMQRGETRQKHLRQRCVSNQEISANVKHSSRQLEQLLDALELSPTERLVMQEHVALGRDTEIVANELGVKTKSLRSTKSRCLARCRKRFDHTDIFAKLRFSGANDKSEQ